MKHILPIGTLIAALFVGCATPAHRHAFEYRFYHSEKLTEDVQKDINELAKEGWRVRSFTALQGGKYVVLERRTK